jgi:DNA-binding transcriptional MerR regulator
MMREILRREDDVASEAPGCEGAADRTYSIGDLASEFGVTLRALRFYEDRGLISPRRRGATRVYDSRDRANLAVILKGKQLGFTLAEIQDMLSPPAKDAAAELNLSVSRIDGQIAHLQRQRADIDSAIDELLRTRALLAA